MLNIKKEYKGYWLRGKNSVKYCQKKYLGIWIDEIGNNAGKYKNNLIQNCYLYIYIYFYINICTCSWFFLQNYPVSFCTFHNDKIS